MKLIISAVVLVAAAAGIWYFASKPSQPRNDTQSTTLKTTPSTSEGAQVKIEDITTGTGEEAKDGDTIKVHYTGTLEDGTKFDSSEGKDPIEFKLGSGMVIPGWEQGIKGMKVGGKRKLTIPSDLAYGAQGIPGAIPANATLLFDTELVEIVK